MKKVLLIMITAAACGACAKHPAERQERCGTLRISGENAPLVSVLTRAERELSELGETLPDAMHLRTLVSSLNRNLLLDGKNPWKFYDSAAEANEENVLYEPGRYVVTIGSVTEDGEFPSWRDLAAGTLVAPVERPYYSGGVLVPEVAEGPHRPFFEGHTEVTVTKGQTVTARVSLRVVNTAVSIRFSDAFRHYFENGAEIRLETAAGSVFTVGYDKDEGTVFWIRPQGFTLSGSAVPQSPSPGIIDPAPLRFKDRTVPDADVQPRTLYTYVFDIDDAGATEGGIRILLNDEAIETIEEEVELNPDAPKNSK